MAQKSEKTEDPFSYIDLEQWNPWWDDEHDIPPKSYHRSDLYWRVKHTLEQDILLIPGAPVTGTEQTLKQVARALIRGEDHESERIAELFGAGGNDSDERSCDPIQICYAKCNDPIAHLVEDYVNEVRRTYHRKAAKTPQLDYYVLLEDIHRLDSWRDQLVDTHSTIQRELPENWTIVATLPMSRLAHETDFAAIGDIDIGPENIDLPHYTQKFRNTLFSTPSGSALRKEIKPADKEGTLLDQVRDQIGRGAGGNTDCDTLVDDISELHEQITDTYDTKELRSIIGRYLTLGGFEPALAQAELGTNGFDPNGGPKTQEIEAVSTHVNGGLERTLYQDVPRLAKMEDGIKRINHPEELHGMIAFLARREFTETTYIDLGEFLSCDTRTIRNKYVDILEDFHIGERATRYDLERDRSLRFYLRSPGYVTALTNQQKISKGKTDQEEWDKRLRLTLADHLRRLLPKYESDDVLQYWRDDDHLVDYVFDIGGTPVPFISEFADDTKGGTIGGLDAFNERLNKLKDDSSVDMEYQQPNLEVIITGFGEGVSAQQTDDDRLRLRLPHWLLLSIC